MLWQDRIIRRTGDRVTFAHFSEFVCADPPAGLGTDVAMLPRLCGDDAEAIDLIDQATKNPAHVHTHDVDNVHVKPDGNSAQAALRRLRKDRPDLHDRVLAGDLSPHAAVEANFRTRTITVPLDPEKLAGAVAGNAGGSGRPELGGRLATDKRGGVKGKVRAGESWVGFKRISGSGQGRDRGQGSST